MLCVYCVVGCWLGAFYAVESLLGDVTVQDAVHFKLHHAVQLQCGVTYTHVAQLQ